MAPNIFSINAQFPLLPLHIAMCISQHATKIAPDISKFPRTLQNCVIRVRLASYHPSDAYKSQMAPIFLEYLWIPGCENQSFMFGEGHRYFGMKCRGKYLKMGQGSVNRGRRKLCKVTLDISYHISNGAVIKVISVKGCNKLEI